MKKLLILFLFFSACSVSEDDFFDDAIGVYTLNEDGQNFILRATGYTIPTGTSMEFRGSGDFVAVLSDTEAQTIGTLISVEKETQALFRLENTDSSITNYNSMGYDSPSWRATTNIVTDSNDVRFDSVIPIATRDDS